MKILCVTPWFPTHPQAQHGNFILDSVNSLIELGHEVTVLVTLAWRPKILGLLNKNWQEKQLQKDTFQPSLNLYSCHYLSIPRHYFCPITLWNYKKRVGTFLKQLIVENSIQLIHAHTEYAGVAAVEVGKQFKIPSVITLHGVSTEKKLYKGSTRKQLFEYPLKETNRVVLVGDPLVGFAKQFVNQAEHFRVVPNGFRSSAAHGRSILHSRFGKNLRFISVSNLEEGKGVDITLQALTQLNSMGIQHWSYKIIGDGSERQNLKKLVATLNLENQVSFLGALSHDKVYDQLMTADVFVLPSYREAFGVAYLEAMSCGLVTIGVEGEGPQMYIHHGHTGFLVKPQCVNSLLNIFTRLLQSSDQLKEIAEAGQAYIRQHFTWKQHAIDLTRVYSELIKE